MEMVKTIINTALVMTVAVSCTAAHSYSWEKFEMDGHRTGVTIPDVDNVEKALGAVEGDVYLAPNGSRYTGGSVVSAAGTMIEAQPAMAKVKQVIGYAPVEMTKSYPECALSNWAVDAMMVQGEKMTGRKADIGILNFGGIRVDMPAGNVLYDDLSSMVPFKNYLSYVKLKGEDVENIFKFFARKNAQVLGGVKFTIRDGQIGELLIGGKPFDRNAVYTVATVDFLLDGGDSLYVAKNALDLDITESKLFDVLYAYVQEQTAKGNCIEAKADGRVTIE